MKVDAVCVGLTEVDNPVRRRGGRTTEVTFAEDEAVRVRIAVQHVAASAALDPVEAVAALQRVSAEVTEQFVVSAPAREAIITIEAEELIGRRVAGDGISEIVAIAIDVRCSGQGKLLDIGPDRVVGAGQDGVGAFPGIFLCPIGRGVYVIFVVAAATHHPVAASGAVENIIAS